MNFEPLHYLASAGGGGSGGDGGGDILGAIGYAAGYFPTKWLKKKGLMPLGIVISSIFVLILTVLFAYVSIVFAIINLIAGIIGISAAVSGVFAKWKGRSKKAQAKLVAAAQADPSWQPHEIISATSQIFSQFQHDWGSMDLASMQRYLAPSYYTHVHLMLYALGQMRRSNITTDIKFIEQPLIVDVHDVDGRAGDRVTVAFSADAKDQLIDTTTNTVITESKQPIIEAWYFVRNDQQWQLEAIEPASANPLDQNEAMKKFATDNGMYYSLNWGRLLLPRGGQLFDKASFTYSVITNHIIGIWEGNLLIQLYRYSPDSRQDRTSMNAYEVGQITLPKTYGGIIVKRREGFNLNMNIFERLPKGYQKVSMEWGDFNKRYNIYATDMEKLTTFELLNPSFMAWLYDQNLHVNIEVIENVVYIYGKNKSAQRYADMMEILKRAYKELKR